MTTEDSSLFQATVKSWQKPRQMWPAAMLQRGFVLPNLFRFCPLFSFCSLSFLFDWQKLHHLEWLGAVCKAPQPCKGMFRNNTNRARIFYREGTLLKELLIETFSQSSQKAELLRNMRILFLDDIFSIFFFPFSFHVMPVVGINILIMIM